MAHSGFSEGPRLEREVKARSLWVWLGLVSSGVGSSKARSVCVGQGKIWIKYQVLYTRDWVRFVPLYLLMCCEFAYDFFYEVVV